MTVDIRHLRVWIGKTETRTDRLAATPVQALAATLDRDDAEPRADDAIPLLAHWLYFLPLHRRSEIGADGHPTRGGSFLVCGRREGNDGKIIHLWAQHEDGALAMDATATLA